MSVASGQLTTSPGIISDATCISLDGNQEGLSSVAQSSPSSDQYQSSFSSISKPASFSTHESWNSIAAAPSLKALNSAISPLDLEQASSLPCDSASTDVDTAIYNDFDMYLGLMVDGIPMVPLQATADEFGFDPPIWISEPSAMDWVSSGYTNAETNVKHIDCQTAITSSPPQPAAIESSRSTPNTNCTPSSTGTQQAINRPSNPIAMPSQQTTPPARRPGRPRKPPRHSQDDSVSDAERRRQSLEKNRLAATKCREKKKAEVHALRDASAALKAENSQLKEQATKLREEILSLREELFTQVFRTECCETEKWRAAMGKGGSEVASGG
jgi:hypothetical protein